MKKARNAPSLAPRFQIEVTHLESVALQKTAAIPMPTYENENQQKQLH